MKGVQCRLREGGVEGQWADGGREGGTENEKEDKHGIERSERNERETGEEKFWLELRGAEKSE